MEKIDFLKNAISNFIANTHLNISLEGIPATLAIGAVCYTIYEVVAIKADTKKEPECLSLKKEELSTHESKTKGEVVFT